MTREEKMNKRQEAGKTYKYKPNPFPKDSAEYYDEQYDRAHKNVSHKTPIASWESIMAKLDNQLAKEQMGKSKNKKVKND